jgi:hypothetical protein
MTRSWLRTVTARSAILVVSGALAHIAAACASDVIVPTGNAAGGAGGAPSSSTTTASMGAGAGSLPVCEVGGDPSTSNCPPSTHGFGCYQPGDFCSDPCHNPWCQDDSDCLPDLGVQRYCPICAKGNSTCMSFCTSDADCLGPFGPGFICAAGGRCSPQLCQAPSDCAANFECSAGQCSRKACTGNSDCSGVCVAGVCYEEGPRCVQCF